tara:strand:+ start:435 stop:779 length:345 start_codon:yes stop_codon:yes gene_type:complete
MYLPEEIWQTIKSFTYSWNKDAIEYQRQFRQTLYEQKRSLVGNIFENDIIDTILDGHLFIVKCIMCKEIMYIWSEFSDELNLTINNACVWNRDDKAVGFEIEVNAKCACSANVI